MTFNYYFSPSRLAFYAASMESAYIAAGSWPSDAVGISDTTWQTYIQQPPSGMALGADANGNPTWVTATPVTLTAQQQAMMLLHNPTVVVNCTSIPALNGTYAADDATRGNITGVAAAIKTGLGLPSGGSTFSYPDASNVMHEWPDTQFVAFAQGVMTYIYNLSLVATGNGTTLPSNTISIA